MGPAVSLPPIYCINLERSHERRARMERRFAHHGLADRASFVTAFAIDEAGRWEGDWTDRASQACFASHLEAMRRVLAEAGPGGAIICEDDCLLHNDFPRLLASVLANLPADAPVCSLGWLVAGWPALRWAGRTPERENLCRMIPWELWTSHMYWVSPFYAEQVLAQFGDLGVEELPCITETILHRPEGFASYPALALQEVLDSTVRPPSDQGFHISGQAIWSYSDYAEAEVDGEVSPLAAEPSPARTIGLAMIVRDEAETIARCLDSVRPLIDTWTICDTGSTDGTPELIEELMKDVPGTLHRRPWRDFGTNRSELMKLAAGTADYLLLVDADMTIERRGPLPPLQAGAYMLHHDGDLDYTVPRLVSGSRRWWYEGSTHEYLATEGAFSQEVLEGWLVVHHGDSGTRGEKLERDALLLERDLERNPENDRATFYLAQTLRDSGELERAIELYRRRVELGGWDEEVYYAAYQAGVLAARSDPDAGMELLRQAVELRPGRAEAIYELSRLCRLRGRHREAYELAKRGLELPYPEDILFVHRDVHDWGLLFELAVAAYWVGELEEALEANEELASRNLPEGVLQAVNENRAYCLGALGREESARPLSIRRLDELVPGVAIGEIKLEVEPDWPRFNPSIAADGDGFRMIVRTANYDLAGGQYHLYDGSDEVRTLNYVAYLDGGLAVRDVAPLVDASHGPPRFDTLVLGYEDCRLIEIDGRWYALATVRDRNPTMVCEIALLALDGGRIDVVSVLPGPTPGRHEKNWMPFDAGGSELGIVYSCDPTMVLRCDPRSGRVEPLAETRPPEALGDWRGGSQGIEVAGGRLFVIHEAFGMHARRAYAHRLVLFDDERVAAASRRFTFTGAPIEICAGMARRGSELVLSFGVADCHALLAVCDEGALLDLLEPVGALAAA